jgi:mRNA-degrading endonuclease toxin of MazEF toxin-antitoxin module
MPRLPDPSPPPFRGDVWDVVFPRIGAHPAVAMTTNALRGRLSSVTVVLVTGAPGPAATHVELGPSAGLTKSQVGYANVTDLHTVPVASASMTSGGCAFVGQRRGRLTLRSWTTTEGRE